MKIKLHTIFKAIEGPGKGNEFIITDVNAVAVTYRSVKSGEYYTAPRSHFEKYLERVNKYWSDTNKAYKNKKRNLQNSD